MVQAALCDSRRSMRVLFEWWVSQSSGRTNYSNFNVTLDCPWAFKVSSIMEGSFAKELLSFIQKIDEAQGDWQDPHCLKTPDEDFVLTCFECFHQELSVEVSLDSSWDDPEWTVQLRLNVPKQEWHNFVTQFESLLSESEKSKSDKHDPKNQREH